jgi:hypothetical protein
MTIPKTIYQTWKTKDVPQQMRFSIQSFIDLNPEYEHRLLDDAECRDFIAEHFPGRVLRAYDKLIPGAYRADLWRYCWLYTHGGVYIDVDSRAFAPLSTAISETDTFVAVRVANPGKKVWPGIYQGFLACEAAHPFLKATIDLVVSNIENDFFGECPTEPTGPVALGVAVNRFGGRADKQPFDDGENQSGNLTFKLLGWSYKQKHARNDAGNSLLINKYNGYVADRGEGTPYAVAWYKGEMYLYDDVARLRQVQRENRQPEHQIDRILRNNADPALVRAIRRADAREKGVAPEPRAGKRNPWKIVSEKDVSRNLAGRPWLVSHGGVSSEYLTERMGIRYPRRPLGATDVRGAVVHYPYPVKRGPSVCIYVYGDIYNSVISQSIRNPHNPSKLHNREDLPPVDSLDRDPQDMLDELLDWCSHDPYGLDAQIRRFMVEPVDYPIVLLKYPVTAGSLKVLERVWGKRIDYKPRTRSSRLESLDPGTRERLVASYGDTVQRVEDSPGIIVRYPKAQNKSKSKNKSKTPPALLLTPAALGGRRAKSAEVQKQISQADVLRTEIKQAGLPGARVKHYLQRDDLELYNERDIEGRGGGLRIKTTDGWKLHVFDQLGRGDPKRFPGPGGVEDPRLVTLGGTHYVLVNGLDAQKPPRKHMYLFEPRAGTLTKLWVNNADISGVDRQKNWTPYVKGNDLYLIYSLDALCVLKVVDIERGECCVVKGNPLAHCDGNLERRLGQKPSATKYDPPIFGSTPLVQWNYPHYVGFAHTRWPWLPVPIIYDADAMEIVRVGDPILFDKPAEAIPRRKNTHVQFPYDLQIKDGEVILGVEFEDQCPTLLHLDYLAFCKQFS